VDEAWTSGVQLAEGVIELLQAKKPFTKENLEAAYAGRRRASWIENEGRVAERARDGFHRGVVTGMIGMGLAGFTKGKIAIPSQPLAPHQRLPRLEDYYRGKIPAAEIRKIQEECAAKGTSAHAALMERCGWPAIPYDGKLLVSQQDALLLGGKVQAPASYADHVAFLLPEPLARAATPGFASRSVRGRRSRPDRKVCRRSTGRSASTAARVFGAARSRSPIIPNARTSSSAPAPADCIRRKTRTRSAGRSIGRKNKKTPASDWRMPEFQKHTLRCFRFANLCDYPVVGRLI